MPVPFILVGFGADAGSVPGLPSGGLSGHYDAGNNTIAAAKGRYGTGIGFSAGAEACIVVNYKF